MPVRAMIKRRIPRDKEREAQEIISELRMFAVGWPGYISGETLRNVHDPEEYLVVSTWKNLEEWDAFYASPKRKELQSAIEALMADKTDYRVYDYPETLLNPDKMFFG